MTGPTDPRKDLGDAFGEHGEWDVLAVGWALSALDAQDEARLAAHLPGCERCTATVREALRTVAELAYAVPEDSPPRKLKQHILAAAAAEPRRPRPTHAVETPAHPAEERLPAGPRLVTAGLAAGEEAGDGARDDRPPAEPIPLAPRRRRWVTRTAVAAGLALVAALGAWNLQLQSRQDQLDQIVAQRDELVARLTEAGPARIAVIRAVDRSGDRYATVVVKQGRIGLITETLPRRPGSATYWLWSMRDRNDRNPVPLVGFNVPKTRFSACNIEPPPEAVATRAFAISEEPGPDRPARPTEVVGFGPAIES
jgi:hypothetical protein